MNILTQLNAPSLAALMTWVMTTHDQLAKTPSKRHRKWDGQTPYGVHPIWCALTLLCEEDLPIELRWRGCQALMQHDILEDTTSDLITGTSPEVRRLVEEMTFPGGTAQEMQEVWTRSAECRLLKLYDKVSNMLDVGWMNSEKRIVYARYTLRLAEQAEANYGALNIIRFAHAICEPYRD